MYKRILVATDGSHLSDKAVANAIELAAALGGTVIAVKVIPRYPQTYFEGSIAMSADDVARVEAKWAEESHEIVNKISQDAAAKGVPVEPLVVKSDVISDALIESAKRHHADLIVMASHGRKGVKRLLLGSETQQVLTHSEIPVLVLR